MVLFVLNYFIAEELAERERCFMNYSKCFLVKLVIMLIVAVMLAGCGGKQQAVTAPTGQISPPTGTGTPLTCFQPDTDEHMFGWGVFNGSSAQPDVLFRHAQSNAMRDLSERMSTRIRTFTEEYDRTYRTNRGNDILGRIESAAIRASDNVITRAQRVCLEQGYIQSNGFQTVWTSIRISVQSLEQEINAEIGDVTTQPERDYINFNADNFLNRLRGN
jgi:hypothetical protein